MTETEMIPQVTAHLPVNHFTEGKKDACSALLTPDTTPTKTKDELEEPPRSPSQAVLLEEHSYSLASSPKSATSCSEAAVNTDTNLKGRKATTKSTKSPSSLPKTKNRDLKSMAVKAKTSVKQSKSHGTRKAKSAPQRSRSKSSQRSKSSEAKRQPERQNHLVTDYFPIRRSYRVTSSELKKRQKEDIENAILSKRESGMKVFEFEGKGRGVVATQEFRKGDFVVEYAGDLVDLGIAKEREGSYSMNPSVGCYMYYFNHKNKRYCVDATAESGRLGRLLNHSRHGNCCTRVVDIDNRPYLILVAARDIKVSEELLYDYGDRSKESLEAHPWLAL